MIQRFTEKIPFKRNRVIYSAVYLIVCDMHNEVYVGSSGDIAKRMVGHRAALRRGCHENVNLQKLYDTYGDSAFYFKVKHTNYTKYEGLLFEEKFISMFNTLNLAKEPTKGGSPNKGRKLTEEWKINLHKNKEYKHNEEVLSKVVTNNKNGACRLKFKKGNEELEFNSWIEASEYFGVTSLHYFINGSIKYKGWQITKLTQQKKRVLLHHSEGEKEFNSAGECDRFLDMWRGATSHYLLRDGKICGFKVEYIN